MAVTYFKEAVHDYLLKVPMTYSEKQIPLFYLLINCISSRSAPQMLPLKHEYTLRFCRFCNK